MKKKSEENKESVKPLADVLKMVEVTPLKDHRIVCNQWDIDIKEGKPVPIPRIFLKSMVTEGVINKMPKL